MQFKTPIEPEVWQDAKIQRHIKILVVDDILYVVKSISRILQSEGYFVLTARNGREALKKFMDYSPDLITVDQKLPDMTGEQLVKLIRTQKESEKAKIIFISAVDDKTEIQEIMKQNIDDYLVKPFKRSRLVDTVKGLVGPAQVSGE